MEEFLFYVQLGLDHVLDFAAYDHILFLTALAIPFVFKQWKKVVILATLFTIAHCTSLALSVYETVTVNASYIEFLIPVTIFCTALYNIAIAKRKQEDNSSIVHGTATVLFGFIHGFGFSNYFKMMMADEPNKLGPLLGFAGGIEVSQLVIILSALTLGWMVLKGIKLSRQWYVIGASVIVAIITIPMLIDTFPV